MSVVRSAEREARSAASAFALASASAFALASAAFCSASSLAFLASLAALDAAASWAAWSWRSAATVLVAWAVAAAVVARSPVSVGISMVSVTGWAALAGAAAPASAMVLSTPPATPARSETFEALRRGFRWLGM